MHTITIAADVRTSRRDFEQASAVEHHTLTAGTYEVVFTDIRGYEVPEDQAYYAQVTIPTTDVSYSYKWEAPKAQPDGIRVLRLYGYEFRAGKDFFVSSESGVTYGFTPQADDIAAGPAI